MTKSIDAMRPVISNDGRYHAKSDILTLHHYEQNSNWLTHLYDTKEKLTGGYCGNSQLLPFADGFKYEGQPIIFTEFGGTHYACDEGRGYGGEKVCKPHRDRAAKTGERDIPSFIFKNSLN